MTRRVIRVPPLSYPLAMLGGIALSDYEKAEAFAV
jgi:hypothetical protein